jgi:hypothetical protein
MVQIPFDKRKVITILQPQKRSDQRRLSTPKPDRSRY